MSTVYDPNSETTSEFSNTSQQTAANRVRENFAACRVKFKWLGTSQNSLVRTEVAGCRVVRRRWRFNLGGQEVDRHQARSLQSFDVNQVADHPILERQFVALSRIGYSLDTPGAS